MITHTLAVATGNAGKLKELAALLSGSGLPLTVRSLAEVAPGLEVVEDGATFAANAIKKARALAEATQMMALADDSGLEVDALGGAPGIYSARYAARESGPALAAVAARGEGDKDARNNAKLLADLARIGGGPWPARFRCVLALVDPFARGEGSLERPILVEGVCAGHITDQARGGHGFGYDPLFVVAGGARTMAELTLAEKEAVSHRARAFRDLVPRLADAIAARNAVLAGL